MASHLPPLQVLSGAMDGSPNMRETSHAYKQSHSLLCFSFQAAVGSPTGASVLERGSLPHGGLQTLGSRMHTRALRKEDEQSTWCSHPGSLHISAVLYFKLLNF